MDDAIQGQLTALGDEVLAASIPDGCKRTTAWCIGQLPALYAKFQATSESRYADEITRLVRGALKELVTSHKACPEAQQLAASVTARLGLLHEEFGLPGLNLKLPTTPTPRSRTAPTPRS